LAWNEQDKSAEYTLKFNSTKRGMWIGTLPPKGKERKQNPSKIYVPASSSAQIGSKLKCKFFFLSLGHFVCFLAGSTLRKNILHSHYTGTIQVMKAVGNHLVLTFCEKAELFTIILTRTKAVFAIDVRTKTIRIHTRVSLSNERIMMSMY
jgi:hypothetical protein